MLVGVPVIQANALLDASYQLYRHVESHKTIVRTVIYALPATLHRQVPTGADGGLWWGSRRTGEVSIGRARDDAVEPR